MAPEVTTTERGSSADHNKYQNSNGSDYMLPIGLGIGAGLLILAAIFISLYFKYKKRVNQLQKKCLAYESAAEHCTLVNTTDCCKCSKKNLDQNNNAPDKLIQLEKNDNYSSKPYCVNQSECAPPSSLISSTYGQCPQKNLIDQKKHIHMSWDSGINSSLKMATNNTDQKYKCDYDL